MGRKLAVIICNFNKKDYVLQCINSVRTSGYRNATIYVVDNASSDGSVEAITAEFGNTLNLIVNHANQGGSGGFNTGMREALKGNYQYFCLLDNDVILHPQALNELVNYLENNPNVAIAGSTIYSLDKPDEIQEMGSLIDWENYYIKPQFKGVTGAANLPKMIDCDYVPACSMLIRTDVIQKVGLMDEGNFIYWDDIEWCYRIKQAGYKIVAISASKVWHKMGVAARTNTFGTYYFWRNRMNFFLKNLPHSGLTGFAGKIFSEFFQALYACNFNRKYHSASTIWFAVEDAFNNLRGQAPDGRIIAADPVVNKLEGLLNEADKILIIDFTHLKTVRDIVAKVQATRPAAELILAAKYHQVSVLQEQFPEFKVIAWYERSKQQYPIIIQVCRHIMELGGEADLEAGIYIDQFGNMVDSQADLELVKNYENAFQIAQAVYYPVFLAKVRSFGATD